MKKIISIMIATIMIFSLSACSGNETPSTSVAPSSATTSTPTPSEEPPPENANSSDVALASNDSGSNILVAYFTRPETDGVDAVSSASRVVVNGEVVGNTQFVAQIIQQSTGGDLFAIETVQEYPGEHDALVDQAADEQDENARPELSTKVDNMDDYDVIFIGYPNWWYDLPMPLYTFLEEYDLSGKTIVPFSTHGGSGFSNTIDTIAELQPDATVITDGFTVSRSSVASAENDVTAWLKESGY